MCIVQHVKLKSLFIFQPIKRLVSICKKCKACCHVLNIPLKDQKQTIMLFGGNGTHCFAIKTSRDYENEKPFPFLKNFLHPSQPSTSEPEPIKVEVIPFMA